MKHQEANILGIDSAAEARLNLWTPRYDALQNWTRTDWYPPEEKIADLAQVILDPTPSAGRGITPSSWPGDIPNYVHNFISNGGLTHLGDDTALENWISNIRWSGARPLTSQIAMSEVTISRNYDDFDAESARLLIPILSSSLIEQYVDNNTFIGYCSSVSSYLQWVMMGYDSVKRYHQRMEVMTLKHSYSWEADDTCFNSGSGAYEKTISVPAADLIYALNDYVDHDTVGVFKRGMTMRESRRFMAAMTKVAQEHSKDRTSFTVESVGVGGLVKSPDWMALELHQLTNLLTAEQKRDWMATPIGGMSVAARGVGDSFRRMAKDVSGNNSGVIEDYFKQFNILWSTISALAAVDLIKRAIPPIAGKKLKAYWLEGLANESI